ncbi:Cytochrome c551 peroxidase precursor [Gimesia panareensis]|uniref:Cytochrome c551 peroxidase n=1 Tax=Gimesia panareensis TaxID=2527978 RepID=A0A517Q3M3_9PLAN|nr:cytochrome c peroxidase [Gimesia panareensis]QDT26230.1 Cytochrome c551 peroxidase precursor [Gimesia panareensis]
MKVSEHRSYPLLLKLSVVTAMFMGLTCAQSGTAQAAEKKSNKVQLGTDELTLGVPGKGPLTKAEIKEWLDNPENHQILEVTLPLGLSAGQAQMKGLKENPLTRAKVELGRQLYFDTRLSSDNTISCASCHHPDEGWGRHTQFGIGVRDQEGGRNSPISYNRILSGPQFWDGRAATLEAQAVGPIANPIEMANTHENAVKTLKKIPGYKMQFKKIFKDGVTIDNVGKAIAAFERAVVTGPSPFDYQEQLKPFLKLDKEDLEDLKEEYEPALAMAKKHPMSKSAKRGMDLFFSEKVNCAACHLGPNLADEKYHNLGVGMDAKKPDLGRYEVTKAEKDKGAFKTPTIRNVALSAPYMHDGSLETLEEVVEHYNKGGTPNPWLSEKVKKLNLSDQDKKDLVAFMKACTGPFPKVETGRLPE